MKNIVMSVIAVIVLFIITPSVSAGGHKYANRPQTLSHQMSFSHSSSQGNWGKWSETRYYESKSTVRFNPKYNPYHAYSGPERIGNYYPQHVPVAGVQYPMIPRQAPPIRFSFFGIFR